MSSEATARYWTQFVSSFRHSPSLGDCNDILSRMCDTLESMENELGDSKIQLLAFLPQHVERFLSNLTARTRVLEILRTILKEHPCSTPLHVQILQSTMVATTTLLIEFASEPAWCDGFVRSYMEEFINYLLQVIRGAASRSPGDTEGEGGSLSQTLERGLIEVAGKTGIHLGGLAGRSQERSLRQFAAESLRELEETFPGLLEKQCHEIFALAQMELSHAAQSYYTLVATITQNQKISVNSLSDRSDSETSTPDLTIPFGAITSSMRSVASGIRSNSFASLQRTPSRRASFSVAALKQDAPTPVPFTLPTTFLASSATELDPSGAIMIEEEGETEESDDSGQRNSSESDSLTEKETPQSQMIFILRAAPYCNKWGISSMVTKACNLLLKEKDLLVQLARSPSKGEDNSISSQLMSLFLLLQLTDDTCLFTLLLSTFLTFPDDFQSQREALRRQVLRCLSPSTGVCGNGFPTLRSQDTKSLLTQWYLHLHHILNNNEQQSAVALSHLQLSTFDSLGTRGGKLLALARIQKQQPSNDSSDSIFDWNQLEYLKEFRYLPSNSYGAQIVEDIFRDYLCAPCGSQDLVYIGTYLRNLLLEAPRFQKILLHLFQPNSTEAEILPSARVMLLQMACQLLTNDIDRAMLPRYFILLRFLLVQEDVSLRTLLRSVNEMLYESSLLSPGHWKQLNQLLAMLRAFILHHSYSPVHKEIVSILRILSQDASNLDIRERSTFLLRLLLKLPYSQVVTILSHSKFDGQLSLSEASSSQQSESEIHGQESKAQEPLQLKCTIPESCYISSLLTEYPSQGANTDMAESLWSSHCRTLENITFNPKYSVPLELCVNAGQDGEGVQTALSLTLRFSPQKESSVLLGRFPLVTIPLVKAGNIVTTQLDFQPLYPLPATVCVQGSWQQDGRIVQQEISPLNIRFEHHLHCLIPSQSESLSLRPDQRSLLVQLVTETVSNSTDYGSSVQSFSLHPKDFIRIAESDELLSALRVAEEGGTDEVTQMNWIGWLAPRYHLVLACHLDYVTNSSVFTIHTDYWPCLVYVEQWLKNIFHR